MAPIWISDFDVRRPRHQIDQGRSLDWLGRAHVESHFQPQREAGGSPDPGEVRAFRERLTKLIDRCACPERAIGSRGFVLDDVASNDFSNMRLYRLDESSHGLGMGERMQVFSEAACEMVEAMYERVATPPADLIHVTCTGLVSPSPAQRLVAERAWPTRVTHAYQMGCYAAVPALRLARGFLTGDAPEDGAEARVDVVHTELCSLHLDPSVHSPEQLVVQSLFADGFVRYCLRQGDRPTPSPVFELLGTSEVIVPGTEHAMSWVAGDHGMTMTLGRDVPALLAPRLRDVVARLLSREGVSAAASKDVVFAVHPGGPKIIDQVREGLELEERQIAASRAVLFEYGNMSSATLPHVWKRVLDDGEVLTGTLVLSLAFGPGLTIAAALLRKS